MKTHPIYFLLSCLILGVGCVSCYPFFVLESDYATSADITAYTSFEFVQNNKSCSDSLAPLLEGEIRRQLTYRGYHQHYKPDLLVNYILINKNIEIRGLLQPDPVKPPAINNAGNHPAERGTPKQYPLKTGTLLIRLIDANLGCVVWQGYASGFHYDRHVPVEKRAKKFVRDIFDHYPFFAKDFVVAKKHSVSTKPGNTHSF